jgi:hypothetical protein
MGNTQVIEMLKVQERRWPDFFLFNLYHQFKGFQYCINLQFLIQA